MIDGDAWIRYTPSWSANNDLIEGRREQIEEAVIDAILRRPDFNMDKAEIANYIRSDISACLTAQKELARIQALSKADPARFDFDHRLEEGQAVRRKPEQG